MSLRPELRLVLLLILLLVCPRRGLTRPPIEAYFGPTESGLGIAEHFLVFLDEAQTSLDLAFYEFRHQPIVDAILDAHRRGVTVRVVVDDGHYYFKDADGVRVDSLHNQFVQRLLDAGIEVQNDSRTGLMHNKFAIRDDEVVWTGSYNPTNTGALANSNNAVEIRSPELAAVYQAEFDEMFVFQEFGITSSRQAGQDLELDGTRFEVLFGPEDDPNARLGSLIANAEEQVLFMQFAFTARDLSDALISRREQRPDLDVRGIFDRLLHRSTGPYGEFAHLTDHGIPVVIDNRREGKMHHKVFIFDPDGANPVVALGSANASVSANQSNDENLLVVHDRPLAQRYAKEFRKHYQELSQARAEFLLRGLPIAGRRVPDGDLVITSGGQAVRGIRIHTPARWKTDERPRIFVHRNGKRITTAVNIVSQAGGKRLLIKNPQLTAYGRNAYLVVKFLGLRLPELAGDYALYIEIQGRDGEWKPLAQHPNLHLLDEADPATLAKALTNLRRLHLRLGKLGGSRSYEAELVQKNLTACYSQLAELLTESVSDGQMAVAASFVELLEQLNSEQRAQVSSLLDLRKNLLRALKQAVRQGDEEAVDLHRRLAAVPSA